MRIQLIDPSLGEHDPDKGQVHARIVPVLALHGLDEMVPAGAIIDVPDDVAGAVPHWRKPDPGDDLPYLRSTDQVRYADGGGIQSVHDLGRGLLAQTDVWAKAPVSRETEGKSL